MRLETNVEVNYVLWMTSRPEGQAWEFLDFEKDVVEIRLGIRAFAFFLSDQIRSDQIRSVCVSPGRDD